MVDRYSIDALNVEGVPVFFSVGDTEVLGFVKFTRSGRPIFRVGNHRKSVDLPRHARPSLWRPVNVETWPDELPEPSTVTKDVAWQSAPPRPATPEPALPGEKWPYPNVALGRANVPPRSITEAEARILRAIRTQDSIDPTIGSGCLWPKDLMIASAVVRKLLENSRSGRLAHFEKSDYADIHVDLSDLRPRPARWVPTPRDVSDVLCLRWTDCLTSKEMSLFMWRSALPPYSWNQIAEFRNQDQEEVRCQYRAACAKVYARAHDR